MKTGRPVPPRRNLRSDLIYLIGVNCIYQTEALHPEFVKDIMALVYLVVFNIDNDNRGNKTGVLIVLDEIERRSNTRRYTDLGSRITQLSSVREAISNDMYDHFETTPALRLIPDNFYNDTALVKSVFLLCDYFCSRISRPAMLDNPNVQYITGLFTSQTLFPHETDEHKWNIVIKALETLFNPTLGLEKYRVLQELLQEDSQFEKKQDRSIFSKVHYNINNALHLRNVLQMICMFISEKTLQNAFDDKVSKTIHNAFFKNQADAKYTALEPVSIIMEYYHEPAAEEKKAEQALRT